MSSVRIRLKEGSTANDTLSYKHCLIFEAMHSRTGRQGTILTHEFSLHSDSGGDWVAFLDKIDSVKFKKDTDVSPSEAVNLLADRLERVALALRKKSASLDGLVAGLIQLDEPVLVPDNNPES